MVDDMQKEDKQVETPKVEEKKEEPKQIVPEIYHCVNCRADKTVDEVNKEPLDFERNEDGSLSTKPGRYSVFCKQCQYFMRIIDPVATAELAKIANRK